MFALTAPFSIFFLMVLSSICNGYALSVLWRWFVVPTFGGPNLGIAAAIGLSLVVHFLTYQAPPSNRTKETTPRQPLTEAEAQAELMAIKKRFYKAVREDTEKAMMRPLIALLFGWCIHLFM